MRALSHFLACIGALSLFTMGCERHEFESTKKLHLEHGAGHHEGGDHQGEKHGEDGHDSGKHHDSEKKEEKKPAEPKKEEARDTGI